jgi:pyrimidine-nucleoside phosphorylase
VGNALELKEAIDTLHGRGPEDFTELVVTLAGEMLRLGGRPGTREELQALARVQLLNGQAWGKFHQLVAAQGGDVAVIDDPELLPAAPLVKPALAPGSGWVAELRADQVGLVTMALGGGRQKTDDAIDHAVGVVLEAKVGDAVEAGQPLCWIHAPDEARLAQARRRLLLSAYCISASPPAPPVLIHKIVE